MPMTAARLTRVRARANQYLYDTSVLIEYPTEASDGMGGWDITWATRGTVSGYLEARSVSDVQPSGGRLESFTEYTLYVADGTTINPGDRVTIDSRQYAVEGVVEADSLRAHKMAQLTLED